MPKFTVYRDVQEVFIVAMVCEIEAETADEAERIADESGPRIDWSGEYADESGPRIDWRDWSSEYADTLDGCVYRVRPAPAERTDR